jgi:hypothetical protein
VSSLVDARPYLEEHMNPTVKKLAYASVAGGLAYAGIKWGVSALLSTTIVAVSGGIVAAYFAFTKGQAAIDYVKSKLQ